MNYKDLQNYFDKGIDGINELMIKLTEDIATIEDYRGQFKANLVTDETPLREALNILTGVHSEMIIVSGVADAYSETNEARELLLAKNNAQPDGKGGMKSPTDEVAKSTAKQNNLVYLRTTNVFKAYTRDCEQMIMTIQSQMNYLKKPIPTQG